VFAEWLEGRMMSELGSEKGGEEEEIMPPGMLRKMVWVQAR